MRLLLDTHVLVWWLFDDPRLRRAARDAIADPASEVFVSAASAWEIGIKTAARKFDAPPDLERAIAVEGFHSLALSLAHAVAAGALPLHHKDPFDRALIAQARAEALTLVTRDRHFALYEVPILAA